MESTCWRNAGLFRNSARAFCLIAALSLWLPVSVVPAEECSGCCMFIDRNDGICHSNRFCGYIDIYSDPPGAEVYGEDGNDWGKTKANESVVRCFGKEDSVPYPYTITLKKLGYKTTAHTFTIRYVPICFSNGACSADAAKGSRSKLTVVLDGTQ